MSETIDQQFIKYIVTGIVDHPDDVVIDRIVDERGVLLTVHVNAADIGRVIGKRGSIAESLRTILRALGMKHSAHYNLKISDGESDRNNNSDESNTGHNQGDEMNGAQEIGSTDQSERSKSSNESVQNVDSSSAETVENETSESDFVQNTRKDLADLDS